MGTPPRVPPTPKRGAAPPALLALLGGRGGQTLVHVAVEQAHDVAAGDITWGGGQKGGQGVGDTLRDPPPTSGVPQESPSSEPEQMGFMFHRVCMKEASTWSSPEAVERCWDTWDTGVTRVTQVGHGGTWEGDRGGSLEATGA